MVGMEYEESLFFTHELAPLSLKFIESLWDVLDSCIDNTIS